MNAFLSAIAFATTISAYNIWTSLQIRNLKIISLLFYTVNKRSSTRKSELINIIKTRTFVKLMRKQCANFNLDNFSVTHRKKNCAPFPPWLHAYASGNMLLRPCLRSANQIRCKIPHVLSLMLLSCVYRYFTKVNSWYI